jgi:hypothetical protein
VTTIHSDGAGRRVDALLAAVAGSLALVTYGLTLAPGVLPGDAGEFQFVPWLAGVAHPTGYPLYCVVGWVWSHLLPIGTVAWRMNLLSSLLGALAVALVYPMVRRFLTRVHQDLPLSAVRLLAFLAALAFAVSPTFWSQAVQAEVYTLHALFVVAMLSISLSPNGLRLPLAAFLFGLSLAHHRTTLLLVPGLLLGLWLEHRQSLRDPRRLAGSLALAALPLGLYLYLPLRAPYTPYLNLPLSPGRTLTLYDGSLTGLVEFVLGGPFGGSVDLSVNLTERLAMAARLLVAEVGWPGIALALVGLSWMVGARRWRMLAWTGALYVAVVGFNLVYLIGDVHVLFIPSYVVVVLWMAAGAATVARLVGRWLVRHGESPIRYAWEHGYQHMLGEMRALAITLVVIPFFLLPLWWGALRAERVSLRGETSARDAWQRLLAQPLPNEAILVSNDRDEIMPLWYYQYVDGLRPDVLGLFPQITEDVFSLGAVLDLALSTDRPVYLIKPMPGLEVKVQMVAPTSPEQFSLWRVIGPAVQRQPAQPLNLRLPGLHLVGYDLEPAEPQAGDLLDVILYWRVEQPLAENYQSYVHLEGVAQSDHRPGGEFYPTSDWQAGEMLADRHQLALPIATQPGTYELRAGMYAWPSLEPLGAPLPLGTLLVRP